MEEGQKNTELTTQEEETKLQVGSLADIETAEKIATQLKSIIVKQKLFTNIKGNNYVNVEGWNTLGAMLGVFPEVVKVERDMNVAEGTGEIKYMAEVIIKTLQGNIISRGFGVCSNKESAKRGADEYVISSMAQTRATGKAFRISFSWVIKLAGYEATPAEEVEGEDFGKQEKPKSKVNEPELPTID